MLSVTLFHHMLELFDLSCAFLNDGKFTRREAEVLLFLDEIVIFVTVVLIG